MTEPHAPPPPPVIHSRGGPSLVWLVPLLTVLIGGWLIFKTLAERGPEITISFRSAEGIEAGKTRIKYKEMEIGVVRTLLFSDDFARVIVKAEVSRQAATLLRRDTRFWVVRPRLGLRGISGLNTLISGSYIELEPGLGAVQAHFEGLETPPVVTAEQAGKKVALLAGELGSIDRGSPIYYQGILVGEVLGYELATDRRSVFIHGFIHAPHDRLVRANTRFWSVSGVDVTLDANGLKVRTESLQSLLFGGIAFDTPALLEPAAEDVSGVVFPLFDGRERIRDQAFTQKLQFVLFFERSVRGLAVGAPVEFKGIRVGEVTDIRLEFDPEGADFRIPVLIEIEPERVAERNAAAPVRAEELLGRLIARGLRARLATGSLITGQLYVELDMRPETPVRLTRADERYPELPTIPGGLDEITASVAGILAKVEAIDLQGIAGELHGVLQGANAMVNGEDLRTSLSELRKALGALASTLGRVDAQVDPVAGELTQAATEGREALRRAQLTLGLLDQVLKPGSDLQRGVHRTTDELAETARALRFFIESLQRNPQSLIFGR
jgi:paraquat-inducible protein B